MVSFPQTIAEVSEDVINSPRFIAIAAIFVKSEQQKCTDEIAKMEERCQQYGDTGINLDPVVASSPSEIGRNPPADSSDDVQTNPRAYAMALSHSRSDDCNRRNVQTAHIDEVRNEIYKIDKKSLADQPSDVPELTFIGPVSELFADAIDYRNYRLI